MESKKYISNTPSLTDKLILEFDHALKTLVPGTTKANRPSPSDKVINNKELSDPEKKHIIGLMRINHCGEVCAQALYQGQAITSSSESIKNSMQESAKEEEDHLAWCEQRLEELDGHVSLLNPIFYSLSFGLGVVTGLAGDKWSLGFIGATEDQVCEHLRHHLDQIPDHDKKTRVILSEMLEDEEEHGEKAMGQGGIEFNKKIKKFMTSTSKIMTKATYKI